MRNITRNARISAAVAAVLMSAALGRGQQTLTWDASGNSAPKPKDGGGHWDLSTTNWIDSTNTNVVWPNTPGSSALFGNTTSAAVTVSGNYINNNVSIGGSNNDAIVVQDLTLGTGTNGSVYNIDDQNGGSLTLNGNINKATGGGLLNFTLFNNLTLGAGDHTISLRDTPGDLPELTINNSIQGTGNIVLDNGSQGYESWGTLVLNTDSNFTGSTTINKGRIVVATAHALSTNSTGIFVGDDGTLSIRWGARRSCSGMTINQPITISRSDYSSDADHTHYPFAIGRAERGREQLDHRAGHDQFDGCADFDQYIATRDDQRSRSWKGRVWPRGRAWLISPETRRALRKPDGGQFGLSGVVRDFGARLKFSRSTRTPSAGRIRRSSFNGGIAAAADGHDVVPGRMSSTTAHSTAALMCRPDRRLRWITRLPAARDWESAERGH